MQEPFVALKNRLWIGATLVAPILFLALAPAGSWAQLSCSSDAPLTFLQATGGVVELQDATVRDIAGAGGSDRAEALTLAGTQGGQAQGGQYRVNTISTNEYPDDFTALELEFDRRVNRFFEINYTRGQYEFADRADLDVQVDLLIPGNVANSVTGGSASYATITGEVDNLNINWFGGRANSLRRIRGSVTFRYSDFANLTQPGVHRADLTVCVEVSGFQ
jgi:hypothetical protein